MKFIIECFDFEANSILFNGSKAMLVNAFSRIINEKYYLNNIAQNVSKISDNIEQLNIVINNDPTLPAIVISTFNDVQQEYQNTINNLQKPLEKVCNYINGTDTDIDSKIASAFGDVDRALTRIINSINNDILSTMTPWENHLLLKKSLEKDIRRYLKIAGAIAIVFVILLGVIPLSFGFFTIGVRLLSRNRNRSR